MDVTFLLLLALAIAVLMAALARIVTRPVPAPGAASAGGGPSAAAASRPVDESPIAVSTEGMTLCPRCAMGNLWTERRCSACGARLGR